MEIEPSLRVILDELASLSLLGEDKKSPYLCELDRRIRKVLISVNSLPSKYLK